MEDHIYTELGQSLSKTVHMSSLFISKIDFTTATRQCFQDVYHTTVIKMLIQFMLMKLNCSVRSPSGVFKESSALMACVCQRHYPGSCLLLRFESAVT